MIKKTQGIDSIFRCKKGGQKVTKKGTGRNIISVGKVRKSTIKRTKNRATKGFTGIV